MKAFFSNIVQWGKDVLLTLYPPCCVGCETTLLASEQFLCTKCLSELPQTPFYTEAKDFDLYEKMADKLPLEQAWSYLYFSQKGKVQHIVHAIKYDNMPEFALNLGQFMGQKWKTQGLSSPETYPDYIVPIPLHPKKFKKRGYNQSERLAAGISKSISVPVLDHGLLRTKASASQTKKSRILRWEELKEVFESNPAHDLSRKHILLVDDVVTTGATLEACGQALIKAGVGKISLCCLALGR